VLVHTLGDFRHDWYTPAVLGGIDEVAHDQGVSIELVGDRDGDIRTVSQRLMQNRPDALACVAPALRHAGLIAEAQRLDVPCIGTGGLLAPLGVPCVSEDGTEGAALAVKHLAERGHRRIGFIQVGVSLPWVFQRHQGYLKGLRDAGLPTTNELAVFLSTDVREGEHTATLARFVRELRPTALLLGNFWPLQYLAPLVAAGELRVPQDVSVVTFDQHPDNGRWLGGIEPTVVELPLREMGRRLAEMAREVVDGKPLARTTSLACTLREGASVRTLDRDAAYGSGTENGNGDGHGCGRRAELPHPATE
jgi:LacI family transcriptional regulator